MRINKAKVSKAKSQLKRLHKVIKSYRVIAHDYYNDEIKFGTLQRFVEDPNYIPKDEKLLKALDLITPPSPYRGLPKWFARTSEALNFFNTKRMQIKQMSDTAKAQRKGHE